MENRIKKKTDYGFRGRRFDLEFDVFLRFLLFLETESLRKKNLGKVRRIVNLHIWNFIKIQNREAKGVWCVLSSFFLYTRHSKSTKINYFKLKIWYICV